MSVIKVDYGEVGGSSGATPIVDSFSMSTTHVTYNTKNCTVYVGSGSDWAVVSVINGVFNTLINPYSSFWMFNYDTTTNTLEIYTTQPYSYGGKIAYEPI